jgi:hypothetical protein
MGSIFGIHQLLPHQSTSEVGVERVSANIMNIGPDAFEIEFNVFSANGILVPAETDAVRTDGLWQTTCFEVFFHSEDAAYIEFNLSPSFAWAAYQFDSYREGMRDLALSFAPEIEITGGGGSQHFFLFAELPRVSGFDDRLSLSAVIEEIDGTKSCWALKHPPGNPDFHHKDCFALKLAPPETP